MPRNSRDGSYGRYNSVRKILKKYLFNAHEESYLRLCSGNKERDAERREFIKIVDQTLESMDYFNRDFIQKEFIKSDDSKFWWVSIYSRSSYYRFRDTAVKAFLEKFYAKYKESYGFDFYSYIG